jgi:hypothetical protein
MRQPGSAAAASRQHQMKSVVTGIESQSHRDGPVGRAIAREQDGGERAGARKSCDHAQYNRYMDDGTMQAPRYRSRYDRSCVRQQQSEN